MSKFYSKLTYGFVASAALLCSSGVFAQVCDPTSTGNYTEVVDGDGNSGTKITAKTERAIRQQALDQIFGNLKQSKTGSHNTKSSGKGDEQTGEFREYRFGDERKPLLVGVGG